MHTKSAAKAEKRTDVTMKKRIFYTELAYVLGLILLAIGTALMERSDIGLSMVIAPAYILHLKISAYLPFFSFGMASYTLQVVLLLCMVLLLRKAKISYLFSFVTAVLYGFILDATIALFALVSVPDALVFQVLCYALGLIVSALGLSFLFHTYLSPEAYDLFVREVSSHFHIRLDKFKTCYDCISCLVAIGLSFLFFGFPQLRGVGVGTVICSLVNGSLIRLWSVICQRGFTFEAAFPRLKKLF